MTFRRKNKENKQNTYDRTIHLIQLGAKAKDDKPCEDDGMEAQMLKSEERPKSKTYTKEKTQDGKQIKNNV